jgi:predicted sugar kinase
MVPVAIEQQAEEARLQFAAVQAAAGSLFSKEAPKAFLDSIEKIRDAARSSQAGARGPASRGAAAAETLISGFAQAGIRLGRKR